ncbi:MAG: protein-L-isoaspartate(D-aspartate) O-methyltransferase [Proteobacteria bacterium]|nr:protein-L-isoaspartate(D-aspartate) O-methyltransferase [Pseudomonadota bacterium]MDA1024244.1 protein-L-isoaspartate(D-aspartate) O-methyltransferase [Pseudomonadota bacterium]
MSNAPPPDPEKRAAARARLLGEIEADARETENWTGRKKFSAAVMQAMARVPRHEFVGPGEVVSAYVNRPLPIGQGQTISQPYIVALMSDLLDLSVGARVLEIGTGSGYQAAVLADLGAHVFSIERLEPLASAARERFSRLGYDNIQVRIGNGFEGWPEEAPFDAIIVTAAPQKIPPALVEQLRPGGRMVIPLGAPHETQFLTLVTKDADGGVSQTPLLPVAFVPMLGE